MTSSLELLSRLRHAHHEPKLEILVAVVAHHRVHGKYPTRSSVGRLLLPSVMKREQARDRISRLSQTMERWGLLELVTPVGERTPVLRALAPGITALEELLGYSLHEPQSASR